MTTVNDLTAAADRGPHAEPPSGERARQVREQAGVSPTAVAAAVGIAERTLLGFERESRQLRGGAARLRLGRVLSYLDALNRTADAAL
jgi:transcriptional regulator with XRE-family HTH domain